VIADADLDKVSNFCIEKSTIKNLSVRKSMFKDNDGASSQISTPWEAPVSHINEVHSPTDVVKARSHFPRFLHRDISIKISLLRIPLNTAAEVVERAPRWRNILLLRCIAYPGLNQGNVLHV
jgi:hypothetical protein